MLACSTSAVGHNRKSVTATRMSATGGKADFDFGRLEVCLSHNRKFARAEITPAARPSSTLKIRSRSLARMSAM